MNPSGEYDQLEAQLLRPSQRSRPARKLSLWTRVARLAMVSRSQWRSAVNVPLTAAEDQENQRMAPTTAAAATPLTNNGAFWRSRARTGSRPVIGRTRAPVAMGAGATAICRAG